MRIRGWYSSGTNVSDGTGLFVHGLRQWRQFPGLDRRGLFPVLKERQDGAADQKTNRLTVGKSRFLSFLLFVLNGCDIEACGVGVIVPAAGDNIITRTVS
ncbi:MAG: hypothetical protein WCQ63_01820 [Methanomethylophilus sp.]